MKLIFCFLIAGFLLSGCINTTRDTPGEPNKDDILIIKKSEPKPEVYRFGNKKYYDEEFEAADSLIKHTVRNFRYVKNHWNDTIFLCFENDESVDDYILLDSNHLFIATRTDTSGFIYEYDLVGNQIYKQELNYRDHYYFSAFEAFGKQVYFRSWARSSDPRYWVYRRDSMPYTEVNKEELPSAFLKSTDTDYTTSPDGAYSVKIDYECMFLIDHYAGSTDTLINLYRGRSTPDWCFNSVCWNDSSNKFYFDNSGEIACIWEVDLVRKTIDKIVPEHFAESPLVLGHSVYYLDRGCIRKTSFAGFGSERVLNESYLYDTVPLQELLVAGYYLAPIDDFPDSLLYPNTSQANIAVNAQKNVYKLKFLYSLSDSLFLITTSMSLSHGDYKCAEPEPYFSEGRVRYSCDWKDGRTYGEQFRVEKYRLFYDQSYYFRKD